MPIFIDEYNQRILHSKHIGGDIVYDAHSTSETVNIEDIPLIGEWEDWTGSGGVYSKTQQQFAATENELQGKVAAIKEKEKKTNLTDRGNTAATHRQRRIRRYRKIGNNN